MVSDADMNSHHIKRWPNSSYSMMNEKYMVRRKTKEPMLQYANLYFLRL